MSMPVSSLRQQIQMQTHPAPADPGSNGTGFFSRLFRRKDSWVRRHDRHACCVLAVLDIIDRDVPVDGLVTEIAQGGLLFRPASYFIFDRTGSEVIVRFSEGVIAGVIVNVKASGYGIRFNQEVEEERIRSILDRFGLPSDMVEG